MKHLYSLNKYFIKYKWYFLLGVFFVVLTNYFRILAPQITGYIVNTVVESISKSSTSNLHHSYRAHEYNQLVNELISYFSILSYDKKILYAGIVLFALAIISGLFMFLMRQTIIVMSRHIEYDQKNEIYQHYQQLDITFFKRNATGDLMNRISEDVSRVRMYTGPALMYFINLIAVIGFSIYFMFQSDVRLTIYTLCPLPVLAIVIYYVNAVINQKSETIQAQLSTLTSEAQETYSGIRVIKSFAQEKAIIDHFKLNTKAYRKGVLSLAKTEALYFPSMGLLIGISTLITVMVGTLDVVHGVEGANVGRIAEFVLYIQMLTFPVSAIGWTASMIQRAAASQKRINEFLLTQPLIKDSEEAKNLQLQGSIELKNIDFTYEHTQIHAINNLSLSIKKGEKIALIGKTGSGKTTLAQLLLKMYNADQGTIDYDEIPIEKIKLNSIRSSISYVPQDVFLFSDTIAENIRFGKEDANEEEVIKAAKEACIYDEIISLPDGFQTLIGERGVTLSGGQKQRISIARAMIKEPNIVVFDDCLSAVDTQTERNILEKLNVYLNKKTAIIITHRIFSLFSFDKIVVIDEGRIIEMGNHEELMDIKGQYYQLFHRQQMDDRNVV